MINVGKGTRIDVVLQHYREENCPKEEGNDDLKGEARLVEENGPLP